MEEEGFRYSTNALSVILKDVMIGTVVAWWRRGEVWKWRVFNYSTMNYIGANSRISTMLWSSEHSNNDYTLSFKTIRIWYIFFRVSKPDTLIMGSKLSCCFRVKKTLPAAEQELEALRDIQREVDCTTAINFSPPNSHWKYVSQCLTWTSEQNLHIRQSLVRQKPSPTGITAPTTTPLGSGVPASLPTTCQRPRRRGVGLPQLVHTLPLVLGPKGEWTQGEWYPCWGERCP